MVFEVGAVAPPEDFDGDGVFSFFEGVGDVKFSREAGIFGVADFLSVDIEEECACDTSEDNRCPSPLEVFGECEGSSVEAGGVVVFGDRWRVFGVGVADVGIDGDAISFDFPV